MERIIKFKAWDGKHWYEWDQLPVSHDWVFVRQIKHGCEAKSWDDPDLKKVLFTGMLDKDGLEIYEKDILGYGDNYPCVVEWNNEEGCFEAVEYGYDKKNKHDSTKGIRRHTMTAYTTPWERLGSVYDSPELIKK